MFSKGELHEYYKVNFLLTQHGYSLTELEDMLLYEREIYTLLLLDFLEKKNKKRELEKQ